MMIVSRACGGTDVRCLGAPAAEGTGTWYRIASSVMRRPVLYAVPIVVVLLALGSPFLRVTWGGTDATVLPASAEPRLVTEALNGDFPGNPTAPIESVVRFGGPVAGSPARAGALARYVGRLDRVPGVIAAQVPRPLRRLYARYGLRETGDQPAGTSAAPLPTSV
jgi:hypothetical protein